MIGGLQPYPVYVSTAVPVLDDIPDHWTLAKLGRIGQLFKGSGGSKEDESTTGVPCVRYGDLYTQYEFAIRSPRGFVSMERSSAYTAIRRGDVLFAASGETVEDIGRSAVSLLASPAVCGGDVLVFRPSVPAVPEFLGYALDSPASKFQKSQMGRGFTIVHIYGDELRNLRVAMPPLDEQAAIVRFLDYMDRRIRRYVAAKQNLIKLLEEQKHAIIHRAVTRGLDHSVHLKPSGEWPGDVPEHWEIRRNGRLFVQRNETGFSDLPIMEVSLRTGVRIRDLASPERKQLMSDRDKYKLARRGDIAYNMMRMWQGAVGIAPVDGLVSPAYVVAVPLPGTEPRYFERLYRTAGYMAEVDRHSRGIVKDRNRLYWEDFKRIASCYPPPAEQVAIADAIDKGCREIEATTNGVRREMDLLREYRTRLVADVVTGKLDVREAAARLPNLEEAEPADETAGPSTAEDDSAGGPDQAAEEGVV